MVDLFDLIGQGLTIFALWLDRRFSPIPWPLIVGSLFLPLVALLRVLIWIMRGRVWPVACKYYHTTQRRRDKPCRQVVPGEWSYCRHHKNARRMHDGHLCDPKVPRWKRKNSNGKLIDRSDIRGVGFVSLMSNRETLLFYKGVAKRPGDIKPNLRGFANKLARDWEIIRSISLRAIFSAAPGVEGVTSRMPRVVLSTRFALISVAVGLILVIVSVIVDGDTRRWLQYSGTTLFLYAWNLFRFGAWKPPKEEPAWRKAATVDTLKAVAVLVLVALLGGMLQGANESMRKARI